MDTDTAEYSQDISEKAATSDDFDMPTNIIVALVVISIFLLSAAIIYCLFGCDVDLDLYSTPPTELKAQD